jgi:cytoskeletal protein RodZ
MSILTQFECQFVGYGKPLTGGRDLFELFIAAVSHYVQEFLSGIPQKTKGGHHPEIVELKCLGANCHRLIVRSHLLKEADSKDAQAETTLDLELTSVQLFDLIEAIDQFYADSQTLPDLTLRLAPVPKRHVAAKEPIAQRVIPAALGVSGLAIAAIALFFIPVPERRPTNPTSNGDGVTEVSPTPSPEASSPPEASPSPTESAESLPDADEIEALLDDSPVITDADTLASLTVELQKDLTDAWDQPHDFTEPLEYRVGVAENGDILGFRYVNDPALAYVDQTPLPDLQYNSVESLTASQDPIAQFRVVFQPEGVVEVSPWYGQVEDSTTDESDSDDAVSNFTELGPEITDSDKLITLNQQLYGLILDKLTDNPDFSADWNDDLEYRVNFTESGQVISVEPLNQESVDYVDDTYLPELQAGAGDADYSDEPQGQFLVVITKDGILQVSPWRGF